MDEEKKKRWVQQAYRDGDSIVIPEATPDRSKELRKKYADEQAELNEKYKKVSPGIDVTARDDKATEVAEVKKRRKSPLYDKD